MKIEKIWLTPTVVWIRTEDGREACELFDDYPRLNDASVEQLCDYDYDEFGIHWNAMDEDLSFEVAQTVHEQLRDMIREHKEDKAVEPLVISRREVSGMLQSCGVPEEKVAAFEEKYDAGFGRGAELNAVNLVAPRKFEVRTPDVTIQVNPERSDLVETRVIDGVKYILVRAEEGVEVNGVNVSMPQ